MSFLDPAFCHFPYVYINYEVRAPAAARSSPEFLAALDALIARIRRTHVGSTLYECLRQRVIITPHENQWVDFPRTRFEDAPAFVRPWNARDARPRGEPARYDRDDPNTPRVERGGDPLRDGIDGTGRGAWSLLYWDVAGCRRHAAREDVILVHEFAHALRIGYGAESRRSVGPTPGPAWSYPNVEEFLAMTIMNMYCAEVGYPMVLGHSPGHTWDARARSGRPELYGLRSGRRLPPNPAREAYFRTVREFERRNMRQFYFRTPALRPVFLRFSAISPRRLSYNPFRTFLNGRGAVLVPPGRY